MFTLEVVIDDDYGDRVLYGPFPTRDEAEVFFNRGTENIDGPRFSKDHRVITDLGRIMNDPNRGINWTYQEMA